MDYFHQESKRLTFRKLSLEDVPKWKEFFLNNDRLKYLGLDLTKNNDILANEWIVKQLERYKNDGIGHLAVEKKENNKFIGLGGILIKNLNGKREYEIAYSLLPKYWGYGFGTEIAEQMKKIGFLRINCIRMISIIDINNIASIKVARKNGMNVLFRTKIFGNDIVVYGIYKKDWKNI